MQTYYKAYYCMCKGGKLNKVRIVTMSDKLTELFRLVGSKYKNLDYTEEQLGYKRRFKGRVVNLNGEPWLIYAAAPKGCWLTNGTDRMYSTLDKVRVLPLLN